MSPHRPVVCLLLSVCLSCSAQWHGEVLSIFKALHVLTRLAASKKPRIPVTVSPLESATTTAWHGNTLEGFPRASFLPGIILNVLWLSDAAHIYENMWSQLHTFKVQSPERPWHMMSLWRKWSFTYFSCVLAGGDIIQHFCLNILINTNNTDTYPCLALQTSLHLW